MRNAPRDATLFRVLSFGEALLTADTHLLIGELGNDDKPHGSNHWSRDPEKCG
jgi:hypothetical protein